MAMKEALWAPEDQTARLNEMMSDDPRLKEAPLRRDVRSLGRLLGDVLKEQAGQALFDRVEHLRLLAIEHRELQAENKAQAGRAIALADAPLQQANLQADAYQLMERARPSVPAMSVEQPHPLHKAFATYFHFTTPPTTTHHHRRPRSPAPPPHPPP